MFIRWIEWTLYSIVAVVLVYAVRHYAFTLQRLFGRQRMPYLDVEEAAWPPVTVVVPCHNEQSVIARCLDALLAVDYPHDRLVLMPVDDRSTDRTGEILRVYAARHPGLVRPFHRVEGLAGKAAVLRDATARVETEIVILFDADYVPNRGLLKRLVAPFFDPEVGAVMGRVVPANVGTNLLTRLLELERAGGYQVDQQARMNLSLVPQFGGTVGGIRKSALENAGGWEVGTLTEDTDATFKLLLKGWITAYDNRAECYEEVPEDWFSRHRQIRRWAIGHNQALARYLRLVMDRDLRLSWPQRIDAALLLGVYVLAPTMALGWLLALLLFYAGSSATAGIVAIFALSSYVALGNFAPFFEIAAATRLDGSAERARLLPMVLLGFMVSWVAVTQAALVVMWPRGGRAHLWHKTRRAGDA